MIHRKTALKCPVHLVIWLVFLTLLGGVASVEAKLTTIEYKKVDGHGLLLDVCVPDAPAEEARPVVVVVHGGGWGSGDRKTMVPQVLETLTKAGYLYVSMDYRLSPAYRWPACRDDVEDAVAWTKENVSKYGGDPDRIGIMGYSAGGHLAFWAAIRDKPPHLFKALVGIAPTTDLLEDLGRRGGPSKAMRDLMSYTDDQPFEDILLKMYEASPINKLHAELPPILLIHGSEDRTVPFQQSVHIKWKIEDNDWKIPCDIHKVEGAPHRQTEWNKFDTGYHRKLVEWLGKNL